MSAVAYVFPGQGSQSIGMLADLASTDSSIQKLFNIASDCVSYDLWQLVQEGPESTLNLTEHTQVAMLCADIAVYQLLRARGTPAPAVMAGHSLGEYAALVAGGALTFEDGIKLVAKRGKLMQDSIPAGTGGMAAIVGLDDSIVASLCEEASTPAQQVTPANYNAIGQVVIAGQIDAVNRMITLAEQNNARLAKLIPVSVPCHCPLLKDAAVEYSRILSGVVFKAPTVPVISNVDLSVYSSAAQIRHLLAEQLYSPVRWVETIMTFKVRNIDLIIESGPGKVLSGLIKRIDKNIATQSVFDTASLEQALLASIK